MSEIELRDKVATLQMYRSEEECRGFWRIAPALGCKGRCAYCFLRGTLWRQKLPVLFVDIASTRRRLEKWLQDDSHYVLNAGELCDSLCWDAELGFTEMAVPVFEQQHRHVLLLLSKFDNVDGLLRVAKMIDRPIKQTIVSWSISARSVWREFEDGTASPWARLEAARKVQEAGYGVRLRIDPMIPIDGWEEEFAELARLIEYCYVMPERITLGSLRFKPRTAKLVADSGDVGKKLIAHLSDGVELGRYRVEDKLRETMYRFMADELRKRLPGVELALCKESEEFRARLGLSGPCHCEM